MRYKLIGYKLFVKKFVFTLVRAGRIVHDHQKYSEAPLHSRRL